MQLIGTKKFTLNEFNSNLQQIGCSFWIDAEDNYFTININGFDKYFTQSIELVLSLINEPAADDSKLKNLERNSKFLRKFEKSSPDDLSTALYSYGLYDKESSYLTRLTTKEISNLSSIELLTKLENITHENYNIHYSGSLNNDEIIQISKNLLNFELKASSSEYPIVFSKKEYTENTIIFLNDSKSVQSRISFYIQGNANTPKERAIASAYNQYFGTGMSAIVFQEIREFRSMAYTAYAVYRTGLLPQNKGYLKAYIGTQGDKTIDAITIMDSLIHQMPIKRNRLPNIQSALLQSVNSTKPGWRDLSESVELWQMQQYKEDPRIERFEAYNSLSFAKILSFYSANIKNRPMLITIVGNKNKIDMKKLSTFGKIIEVDKKDIMN